MPDAIARTPATPYYAVIFTSVRTADETGYGLTSERMAALARDQRGFLGMESVRSGSFGITVSYWSDLEAIAHWKQVGEHVAAQEAGRSRWYHAYSTRVACVEREVVYRRPDPES